MTKEKWLPPKRGRPPKDNPPYKHPLYKSWIAHRARGLKDFDDFWCYVRWLELKGYLEGKGHRIEVRDGILCVNRRLHLQPGYHLWRQMFLVWDPGMDVCESWHDFYVFQRWAEKQLEGTQIEIRNKNLRAQRRYGSSSFSPFNCFLSEVNHV